MSKFVKRSLIFHSNFLYVVVEASKVFAEKSYRKTYNPSSI